MDRFKKLALLGASVVVVVGIVLFLVGFFKPKGAGLLVQSQPAASVFVDGEQVGRTPYNGIFKPGEVVVKLVPESFDAPLTPYETKVTLVSGVETIIAREFGGLEALSSGGIISFEKASKEETSIAVLSDPDSAQIKLNGVIRGFAPYKTADVHGGKYVLSVQSPGYKEKTIEIQTFTGYMLTAVVKLAPAVGAPQKEEDNQTEVKKLILVEVLSTPTGFLRVRSEPSTLSDELGRVTPGKRYNFIEEDEKSEWIKIEYEEGKEGWISSEYAKKFEIEEGKENVATTSAVLEN